MSAELNLDAIRARIADCSTYNFGMRNANTLAKEDAPALVAEVERLRGIVERVWELHPREVLDLHESHGEEAWCPECQFHYPCRTICALEGE